VEQDERGLQPGDDEVLVVTRVGDVGGAVTVTRQVLEEAAAGDLELGRALAAASIDGHVELEIGQRPAAVHRVEVERRRARVGRVLGFRRLAEAGRQVERHVVVEELAHERRAGRVGRVVRVVGAQRGIGDQQDGPLVQRIPGVEHAARLADLAQRVQQARAHVVEEWVELREEAAEPILADDEAAGRDVACAWAFRASSAPELPEATAAAPSPPRNRRRLIGPFLAA
jgi:hypothetical protein